MEHLSLASQRLVRVFRGPEPLMFFLASAQSAEGDVPIGGRNKRYQEKTEKK